MSTTKVILPSVATAGTQLRVNDALWEWRGGGWCLILHALGWFTITDRGIVATIAPEELGPGPGDGRDILYKRVLIDGSMYIVHGVETCRVNHAGRCSRPYGLLVKPVVNR